MKPPAYRILFTLLSFSAFAEASVPAFYSQIPTVPPGINSAVYAAPREDWLQRVKANFEKVAPMRQSIQLVFDGDSITDWWQTTGKRVWEERFGNLHACDFAIAGDRTENLRWRLSQGQVAGMAPKLVVLMIGTNNLGANSNEQIVEGIKSIVAEYQKRCPRAAILLQGIFPRSERPADPIRARIKAINASLARLNYGEKVTFVDIGDKFLAADGTLTKDIMPDGLHPSEKGYTIWANAIAPILQKYFPQAAMNK